MTQEEQVKKRFLELYYRAERNRYYTFTTFLGLSEMSMLQQLICSPNGISKASVNYSEMNENHERQIVGLTVMFDGYITKCSISSPIELKCENLASGLKKISCPKYTPAKNMTVNDFLAEDGILKLLSKSGLKLHPDTKSHNIDIGKVALTTDLTVADVLTNWAKYRLYAYVKYHQGEPCIADGRTYFSSPGSDCIGSDQTGEPVKILFNYNVADDNLTLMDTDKNFLAVEASSFTGLKFYKITIRKNPEYDPGDANSKKWQVMNETTLSKKAQKAGAVTLTASKDRIDLSTYNIVPYMSRKIGISNDDLLEEAIKYFESYNVNGIEG